MNQQKRKTLSKQPSIHTFPIQWKASMRSPAHFKESARVRARERIREQHGQSADVLKTPVTSKERSSPHDESIRHSKHDQISDNAYFANIRNKIYQSPVIPGAAAFRSLQTLLPHAPTDSFTPETWWIVDRQYRPKLRHGATPIIIRSMKAYGWSEAYARRVLAGYKQFLQLKSATKDWDCQQLEPSREINRLWQQHILDPVNYIYDCILLCGHILGHSPDEDEDINERYQRRQYTKRILESVYDEIDGEVWREVIISSSMVPERDNEQSNEVHFYNQKEQKHENFISNDRHPATEERTSMVRRGLPMTRKERRARSPRQEPLLLNNDYQVDAGNRTHQGESSMKPRFGSPIRSSAYEAIRSAKDPLSRNTKGFMKSVERTKSLVPSPRSSIFNRHHEAYRSPPRPRTPVTESLFSPMATSAFQATGNGNYECRIDCPTPRDMDEGRLGYEIETDWGVQSFEIYEEELQMDPIDARRQGYFKGTTECNRLKPLSSPAAQYISRHYRSRGVSDECKPVTICIRDQVGVVTTSRARRSTKLGRIFTAYAMGKGIKPACLSFYLNGKPVDSSDTPASLNLRDHDKIDCVVGKART